MLLTAKTGANLNRFIAPIASVRERLTRRLPLTCIFLHHPISSRDFVPLPASVDGVSQGTTLSPALFFIFPRHCIFAPLSVQNASLQSRHKATLASPCQARRHRRSSHAFLCAAREVTGHCSYCIFCSASSARAAFLPRGVTAMTSPEREGADTHAHQMPG